MLMHYHPKIPIIRAADVHEDVKFALKRLPDEVQNGDDTLCMVLFELLMSRLIPKLEMEKNTKVNMFNETHKVINYLIHNSHEPVTLGGVAEQIGINRYQLSRLFAREFGISFPRYLRQLRVENAKDLLLSGNDSISDIAVQCGFATLRGLELAFKEFLGMTPREFRRK